MSSHTPTEPKGKEEMETLEPTKASAKVSSKAKSIPHKAEKRLTERKGKGPDAAKRGKKSSALGGKSQKMTYKKAIAVSYPPVREGSDVHEYCVHHQIPVYILPHGKVRTTHEISAMYRFLCRKVQLAGLSMTSPTVILYPSLSQADMMKCSNIRRRCNVTAYPEVQMYREQMFPGDVSRGNICYPTVITNQTEFILNDVYQYDVQGVANMCLNRDNPQYQIRVSMALRDLGRAPLGWEKYSWSTTPAEGKAGKKKSVYESAWYQDSADLCVFHSAATPDNIDRPYPPHTTATREFFTVTAGSKVMWPGTPQAAIYHFDIQTTNTIGPYQMLRSVYTRSDVRIYDVQIPNPIPGGMGWSDGDYYYLAIRARMNRAKKLVSWDNPHSLRTYYARFDGLAKKNQPPPHLMALEDFSNVYLKVLNHTFDLCLEDASYTEPFPTIGGSGLQEWADSNKGLAAGFPEDIATEVGGMMRKQNIVAFVAKGAKLVLKLLVMFRDMVRDWIDQIRAKRKARKGEDPGPYWMRPGANSTEDELLYAEQDLTLDLFSPKALRVVSSMVQRRLKKCRQFLADVGFYKNLPTRVVEVFHDHEWIETALLVILSVGYDVLKIAIEERLKRIGYAFSLIIAIIETLLGCASRGISPLDLRSIREFAARAMAHFLLSLLPLPVAILLHLASNYILPFIQEAGWGSEWYHVVMETFLTEDRNVCSEIEQLADTLSRPDQVQISMDGVWANLEDVPSEMFESDPERVTTKIVNTTTRFVKVQDAGANLLKAIIVRNLGELKFRPQPGVFRRQFRAVCDVLQTDAIKGQWRPYTIDEMQEYWDATYPQWKVAQYMEASEIYSSSVHPINPGRCMLKSDEKLSIKDDGTPEGTIKPRTISLVPRELTMDLQANVLPLQKKIMAVHLGTENPQDKIHFEYKLHPRTDLLGQQVYVCYYWVYGASSRNLTYFMTDFMERVEEEENIIAVAWVGDDVTFLRGRNGVAWSLSLDISAFDIHSGEQFQGEVGRVYRECGMEPGIWEGIVPLSSGVRYGVLKTRSGKMDFRWYQDEVGTLSGLPSTSSQTGIGHLFPITRCVDVISQQLGFERDVGPQIQAVYSSFGYATTGNSTADLRQCSMREANLVGGWWIRSGGLFCWTPITPEKLFTTSAPLSEIYPMVEGEDEAVQCYCYALTMCAAEYGTNPYGRALLDAYAIKAEGLSEETKEVALERLKPYWKYKFVSMYEEGVVAPNLFNVELGDWVTFVTKVAEIREDPLPSLDEIAIIADLEIRSDDEMSTPLAEWLSRVRFG